MFRRAEVRGRMMEKGMGGDRQPLCWLTSNGPLLDEDCEDSQDANGLNGSRPEVVDVGHAIKNLHKVTGNEADAVRRLLLGNAWLQEDSQV